MIGQQFGGWTVLERGQSVKYGNTHRATWLCRCECGTERVVDATRLRRGLSTNCGCRKNKASAIRIGNMRRTHGASVGRKETPEYRIWKAMKTRCLNPNFKQYKDYGGRGIKVCKRWLKSFESFLQDMGPRPSPPPRMTIERLDNNGNYTPTNCVWITYHNQRLNQRADQRT